MNKIVAIELIVRLMLRVVIKVYELHNNVEILANNPALQNHLQEAEEKFPDIFQNHAEFTSKMIALVGASPFGGCGSRNTSSCNLRDNSTNHGQNNMNPLLQSPIILIIAILVQGQTQLESLKFAMLSHQVIMLRCQI